MSRLINIDYTRCPFVVILREFHTQIEIVHIEYDEILSFFLIPTYIIVPSKLGNRLLFTLDAYWASMM